MTQKDLRRLCHGLFCIGIGCATDRLNGACVFYNSRGIFYRNVLELQDLKDIFEPEFSILNTIFRNIWINQKITIEIHYWENCC